MESASSLLRTTLNCHMTPRWTTSLYIQRAMQKLSSCYTLYKSGDLLVAGLSIFNFSTTATTWLESVASYSVFPGIRGTCHAHIHYSRVWRRLDVEQSASLHASTLLWDASITSVWVSTGLLSTTNVMNNNNTPEIVCITHIHVSQSTFDILTRCLLPAYWA